MNAISRLGDLAVYLKKVAVTFSQHEYEQLHQELQARYEQLIKFRREGKNVLYSLADDHVKTILEMGLEHVLE